MNTNSNIEKKQWFFVSRYKLPLDFIITILLMIVLGFALGCNNSKKIDAANPEKLTSNESKPNVNWLKIEPGSFVFGSPESRPCRAPNIEIETPVKLTRPFVIADSEITQAQWKALDFKNPSQPVDDSLPVTFINFFEALVWCNKLSKLEGLDTCYDLSNCHNSFGTGCNSGRPADEHSCWDENINYNCTQNVHKYGDVYSCPGYRLPTTVEWEYAAKSDTNANAHTYGGDVTSVQYGFCEQDTALDDIAWYCNNSNNEIHPVKQKLPNPWGLYDVLGNVYEWTDYFSDGQSLREGYSGTDDELVDPVGPSIGDMKDLRGGNFATTGCYTSPSYQFAHWPLARAHHTGFRPVRTLFE